METSNDVAVSSKSTLSPDSNATGVRVSSPATRQFRVERSHFLASAPSAPPTQTRSRPCATNAIPHAKAIVNLRTLPRTISFFIVVIFLVNLPFLFPTVIFTYLLCHNSAPRTRENNFQVLVLDGTMGNLIR